MLAGCLLALIMSCSSDNPVTPPQQGSTSLGTLVSNPNTLIQNTATDVIFQFTLAAGVTLSDSTVKLNKKDGGGGLTEVGILRDNGDLANGDEILGDGIFSTKASISESVLGTVKYVASATISEAGVTKTATSSESLIEVYATVSDTSINKNINSLKLARSHFITALGGNLNNYSNAVNQTITFLQSQPGISSVSVTSGNNGIEIKFSNGINGGMIFPYKGSNGSIIQGGMPFDQKQFDSIRTERSRSREIPVEHQTIGESVSFGDFGGTSNNVNLDPNKIGNRNVMLYAPYKTVFYPDKVTIAKNRFSESECKGFQITEFSGSDATVKALEEAPKFGFVFMDTHGIEGKILFTAEKMDISAPNFFTYHLPLLIAGKIGYWERVVISNTGTIDDTATVYTVYSKFIKDMNGTFPNSIVFNSSCESTMNPDLENAFVGKGAKSYYGYDKVVWSDFAATMIDTVAKRFARGLNSGQAYFNATDPGVPHAIFQLKRSSDMGYSFTLENGNYETGTLDNWTKAGDGRVIIRLGSVNPTQGSYMGIISTGLGFTTSSGSLSQCVKILNTQSNLVLKWNFLSEEFLEYIGSQYQDFFQVSVVKSDGSRIVLFRKTVDQIAAQFGATKQDPGQLISVSPQIVFDRGGVYMTGWQSLTLDVAPYRGQTITIDLEAGDVGDSIFDTAILMDELSIQ